MMKKLLVGLTALALVALVVGPALAHGGSEIEVENDNHAYISNTVNVTAQTGGNKIITVKGGQNSGDITTGDAYADSIVSNTVNSNSTKIKASCRRGCTGDIEVENDNGARVDNDVDVTAQTGGNKVVSAKGGINTGGDIRTGDTTAYGDVINIVNTNITRIRR